MKPLIFSLILITVFAQGTFIFAQTTTNTGAGGNVPGSLAEEWYKVNGSNDAAKRPVSIKDGSTGEIKYLGPDGGYYAPGTKFSQDGKDYYFNDNGVVLEFTDTTTYTVKKYGVDQNGNITSTTINNPSQSQTKTPTNIPLLDQIVDSSKFGKEPLSRLLNQLFYIGLISAVVLAIIMIIRGGIEYMTIDSISGKDSGKKRVQAALGGLVLAFAAILILNTINPGLTNLSILFPRLQNISSIGVAGGLNSGTRTGTDANGNPIYVPSTPSGEGPISPVATAYSPQQSGDAMEGGYASSKPGLDGQFLVRTLEDYEAGNSPYITLAGDPILYGKSYIIPQITYKKSNGETVTLTNVKGYVHDTGSAFTGKGTSRIDIPVGKDHIPSTLGSQPFSQKTIEFIPAK